MGVVFLLVFIFLLSWIAALINWFIGLAKSIKLRKTLKSKYPEIRCHLGSSSFNRSREFGLEYFFRLILSFGSYKASRNYWNLKVDVNKIENLDDNKIKQLLKSSIRITSFYFKIWIIGFSSMILGGILSLFLE